MVTLVGSIGSSTKGSDVVGESDTLVIRGGFGAGKVIPDLKCISATFRA